MHYRSVRQHLRPYVIVARRRTTINHAFAAAIAPHDKYDEQRVRHAVELLGQSPDEPLVCAYCGGAAATWDHIYATVVSSAFSGHGHRLGNLLPCCKPCNSAKGNKDWETYLRTVPADPAVIAQRVARIRGYLAEFEITDDVPDGDPDYSALQDLRKQVLELLSQADELAARIRHRAEAETQF
jgi:hypothetical protein